MTAGKYIQSGSTALNTGGSNSIAISKANLPNVKLKVDSFSLTTQPHTHKFKRPRGDQYYNNGGISQAWWGPSKNVEEITESGGGQNTGTASPSTEALGSGTALSIQPSYITLKFWKRLS